MSDTTYNDPINVEHIRELVPHAGKMCLLQRVLAWNDSRIHCATHTHLDKDNPLRRGGHLSSVCAIEYAAQAMALHGALKAAGTGDATGDVRHGYLASVRDIHCRTRYLDQHAGELVVTAEIIFGASSSVIYSFVVAVGDVELVTGRAAVVLA